MKTPTAIILFGLVTAALAQYGIPDDDDEPPVRAPNPAFYVSHYQGPPTQNVVTVPKAAPKEHLVKVEPQGSIATGAPPPAKILVTPSHVIEEKRPASENSPLVPLRVAAKSYPLHNANVPFQKIEFTDDGVRISAPSASYGRVVSTPVIVKDSYSRHPSEVKKEAVPIVKYLLENDTRGKFRLETHSADGTTKHKNGHLKDLGGHEGPVQVMHGSYSYTGDDGKNYQVDWTADEKGFRATGDHLPAVSVH